MKKIQLFILIFICVQLSFAQQRNSNPHHSTATVCSVIPLGLTENAFSSNGGSNTLLWYDKDINTIAFIHRPGCNGTTVTTSGYFDYDVSTNGGSSWNISQGPIYGNTLNVSPNCPTPGPHPGWFPKGVIYNPPGNTDPVNAHIAYTGIWNGSWGGQVHGTGHLNLNPPAENYDSLPATMSVPEDIFITKQGATWIVAKIIQANGTFADTFGIYKGVWNGSDFIYTYHPVYYSVNPSRNNILDMKIAFADDGLTGYIALTSNQDAGHIHFADSTLYIQVYKTIDGGQTWSCSVDLDTQTSLDSALYLDATKNYMVGPEMDVVVDKHKNLHIVTTVMESRMTFGTWDPSSEKAGLFDIYSTNGGLDYSGQLLARPQTMIATFGVPGVNEMIEYSRPFASRSWDGSKIYFGFFDTDTISFGISTNQNPDLRLIGYDVDNDLWTADLSNLSAIDGGENITTLSNADGACTFGEGSYYCIDNGNAQTIPVTYMVVGNAGLDVDLPCNYFYIDCAASSGTFTHPGHPLYVPVLHSSPLCDGGSGAVLGMNDKASGVFYVSENYPNPFTGKTSFDITLDRTTDVIAEVKNMLGQTLLTANFKKMQQGASTFSLDCSSLSKGIYIYTVKAGCNVVTRTMSVEN